jgi:copper/silver efflux system protein
MIGGMVSSTFLTLIVIPAIYGLVKERGLWKQADARGVSAAVEASPVGLAAE